MEEVKGEIEELNSEIKRLEEKIKRVEEEIDSIKEGIPEEELRRFEELKEKFNGLVFADISSGACEGCGMTFSPAEFKELLKNLEPGKTKCPYCGRFIYSKVAAR